jgi:omega-amidase
MTSSLSSPKELRVTTLQLSLRTRYQENLDLLRKAIDTHHTSDLIVAPEVLLTGFDYDHLATASKFSLKALKELKKEINQPIVIFTLITQESGAFFNTAVVIHRHKILYQQKKSRLFRLGDEHHHFNAGEDRRIKPFEINGVTYGILICFELRFMELWQRLKGVDILIIPAQWGIERKKHLEALSQALAIMNQSFVVVSNASTPTMASSSAIINPFGKRVQADHQQAITETIDLKEIKKMRRYLQISSR